MMKWRTFILLIYSNTDADKSYMQVKERHVTMLSGVWHIGHKGIINQIISGHISRIVETVNMYKQALAVFGANKLLRSRNKNMTKIG